jgi:hypothetical protein
MTDCAGGSVQRFIRIAPQTNYATEGVTFKYCGLSQNADDNITVESFEARGLENINATQNKAGVRTSTTSVDFDYQIGRVFELAFGTPSHAETTTDWVHTFDVTKSPPYLTVVVGSDAEVVRGTKHTGHLVDTFNIQYELNGNVQVSVSTLGNFSEGVTTKPSHTVPVSPVLTFRDATLTLGTTEVKRVQSASINITHQIETVAGSEQDPSCVVMLGRTVEWTANAAMNTNDFRDYVKNNNITDVEFEVDNGVTLGSGKRGFKAELDNIVITSLEETGSVGSITTFTISGTGIVASLVATDGISNVLF